MKNYFFSIMFFLVSLQLHASQYKKPYYNSVVPWKISINGTLEEVYPTFDDDTILITTRPQKRYFVINMLLLHFVRKIKTSLLRDVKQYKLAFNETRTRAEISSKLFDEVGDNFSTSCSYSFDRSQWPDVHAEKLVPVEDTPGEKYGWVVARGFLQPPSDSSEMGTRENYLIEFGDHRYSFIVNQPQDRMEMYRLRRRYGTDSQEKDFMCRFSLPPELRGDREIARKQFSLLMPNKFTVIAESIKKCRNGIDDTDLYIYVISQ